MGSSTLDALSPDDPSSQSQLALNYTNNNISVPDYTEDVVNSDVVIYNYNSNMSQLEWERERVRIEFYNTYDVMTGVRIAGTLGGFFSLMIMLVMYKSRTNSSSKTLKDPKLAAAAAEMVLEEEERELQDALEASGLSLYSDSEPPYQPRQQRLYSLGNISAPALPSAMRYSSVGGYSSLLDPPKRNAKFMKSASVSYDHYEPLNFEYESRRHRGRRRQSSVETSYSLTSKETTCYRPSRRSSRCSGERLNLFVNRAAGGGRRQSLQSSCDSIQLHRNNKVILSSNGKDAEKRHKIKLVRLRTGSREENVDEAEEEVMDADALVSLDDQRPRKYPSTSSFIVASVDYQDSDLKSVGSDSLFSESYVDTDEDLDQFSSDESSVDQKTVVRLNTGIYHKLKVVKRVDNPSELLKSKALGGMMIRGGNGGNNKSVEGTTNTTSSSSNSSSSTTGGAVKRSIEMKSISRRLLGRSTSNYLFPVTAHANTMTAPKRASNEFLYLPGTSTWSKETLF